MAGPQRPRLHQRYPRQEALPGSRIRQGRERGTHLLAQGLSPNDRSTFAPPGTLLAAFLVYVGSFCSLAVSLRPVLLDPHHTAFRDQECFGAHLAVSVNENDP